MIEINEKKKNSKFSEGPTKNETNDDKKRERQKQQAMNDKVVTR